MSATESAPIQAGEVAHLYVALSRRLRAVVRAVVPASESIVEDACQVAWFRLIRHRQHVGRDTALGWLSATAVHEARKLVARQLRDASLEEELAQRGEVRLGRGAPGSDELLEARERLHDLGGVTARQRRLLWLHAMGWSYAEIAQHEGCTLRTVQRQLLRAKRALRSLNAPAPAFVACARPG
jgi:RNA polymerase sigma factor (sigma-70 family)